MAGHENADRPNRVSSFILCAAIGGAPLPFGSRDPITVAFWCFLLGLGLLFASPRQLRRGHFLLLGGIALIVACYGFVLHEQLSDHPWIAAPNPIWAKASELLGEPLPPSVSIIRGEAFYALGAPLANVLALDPRVDGRRGSAMGPPGASGDGVGGRRLCGLWDLEPVIRSNRAALARKNFSDGKPRQPLLSTAIRPLPILAHAPSRGWCC